MGMTTTDNENAEDKPKRLVRVPIAGYVLIEIDADIEPKASIGWASATEFEQAVLDVADEVTADMVDPGWHTRHSAVIEWELNAHRKLVAGNAVFVDCYQIEDDGVEEWD